MKNNYRRKDAVIVMIVLAVFLYAIMIILICFLALIPMIRSADPDRDGIQRYFNLIVYGTCFLVMGMNLNVFTANNLVKEKAQRIVESILAAPVGVRRMWLARSLAVFIPGLVLSEVFSLITYFAFNCFIIAPRVGFIISPLLIVNGFIIVPLLYFPLSCLVILVGLTGNPISGNIIAQVYYSALITVVINLVVRADINVGSVHCAIITLSLSVFTVLLIAVRG
jgi:ABC-2 type transport system permease protein